MSEATRIAIDRQLYDFRNDESTTTLAFPPTLDKIGRKFVHEAVGRLGLTSKSRNQGEARFITISKKQGKLAGGNGAELPPILVLDRARESALESYFSAQPPQAREVEEVMAAAAGEGMHAAAELAIQKRHKAGLLDRHARAMSSAGISADALRQRASSYRREFLHKKSYISSDLKRFWTARRTRGK